jgi:hypothetical protein
VRPNERRDSGQHDLSRPWLDQLVDMDPEVAKFGPAIDGQSAATHAQAKHVLKRRKPLSSPCGRRAPTRLSRAGRTRSPQTSLGPVLHARFDVSDVIGKPRARRPH